MYGEFLELRKKIIEKDFLRLNQMQREAVFHTEGPLLILAGAGSGKTTVIVNRIFNLIKYGKAHNSDKCYFTVTENDIEYMKYVLEGNEEYLFDVEELLKVDNAKPWEILAITFTNKAANELKERLVSLLGEDGNDVCAGTFHSFCARVLRRYAEAIGYSSSYTIYDTDDSKRVMKECMRQLHIEEKFLPAKLILSEISHAKDSLITPDEYEKNAGSDIRLQNIARAYKKYSLLLKKANAMDFDDIIVNTVKLFEENPDILDYYHNKFKYIMVDEYQDTNFAQYRLVETLARKRKNICVVGDDDQSIYKFRGATIENILEFENQYRDTKVIRLEENYRSTQNILDAANSLISHNLKRKGKSLWTSSGRGNKITVNTAYDEQDESRFIYEKIADYVKNGGKFGDNTILYRMNSQSNVIENTFIRMGVPYRIIGGHRFYERKEIRDAIAYLTVLNNPSDDIRLRRIINEPKRGIGDTTVNKAMEIATALGVSLYDIFLHIDDYPSLSRSSTNIKTFVNIIEELRSRQEELSLKSLLEECLSKTGYYNALMSDTDTYTDRKENLDELCSNLLKYQEENEEATLEGFLEEVALLTDIDNYNASADAVTMMTLHSAKGLEFDNVFIVGMEEGIFPGMQAIYDSSEIEEERRLCYVGITRAKKNLYLTNAKSRMLFGSTNHNRPSRFISEIPEHLYEDISKNSITEAQKIFFYNKDMGRSAGKSKSRGDFGTVKKDSTPVSFDFKIGDTVRHKVFGQGVVLSCENVGNDCLLEIAFEKGSTKKLMAKFAKLEKI